MDLSTFRHPSLQTAVGTFLAYGAILVGMFLALFVLPTVIFTVL